MEEGQGRAEAGGKEVGHVGQQRAALSLRCRGARGSVVRHFTREAVSG